MGDAFAAVQLKSKKKRSEEDVTAPTVDLGPTVDGAMGAPGEALVSLGGAHAARLLSSLQLAGGNLAVQTELDGLNEGVQAMNTGKAEKDAFDAMSDMQKVAHLANKNGGELPEPSGQEPPEPGTPPEGATAPGDIVASHSQRAGDIAALSAAYATLQAQAASIASLAHLDEESQATFLQAADQYGQTAQDYAALAERYLSVAGEIGGTQNEFAFAAVAPQTAGAMFQERMQILTEQQAALSEAALGQSDMIGQVESQAAEIDAKIASVEQQKAAAADAAEGDDGGSAAFDEQCAALRQQRASLQTAREGHQALAGALQQKAEAMLAIIEGYAALLGVDVPSDPPKLD